MCPRAFRGHIGAVDKRAYFTLISHPAWFILRSMSLNPEQQEAFERILRHPNIFLTGPAGTGKSYLLKHVVDDLSRKKTPYALLASTGAAAVLVGGRTFHSFFGLRTLSGPLNQIIATAVGNRHLRSRLRKAEVVVLDEVSMLSGTALAVADTIARQVRQNERPWGGLRIIAVGDFLQLPPISQGGGRDWAFMHPVWQESQFETIKLEQIMRSDDAYFLAQLYEIRQGQCSESVREYLNARCGEVDGQREVTQLFARREAVEKHNYASLQALSTAMRSFETFYTGDPRYIESLKKSMPISPVLHLKEGALVMIRINDPKMRYVNGTLGHVEQIDEDAVHVRVGRRVFELEKMTFTLLDGAGEVKASAKNFPISLAWASTIHKIQGATVSGIALQLNRLWDPGQAYVALSRVRNGDDVFLKSWDEQSIIADPLVCEFYQQGCPADFGSSFEATY